MAQFVEEHYEDLQRIDSPRVPEIDYSKYDK
jgi:hypothetical protein